MRRIDMEEAFHFKSGEDMVLTIMTGTKGQREMGQEAIYCRPRTSVPDDGHCNTHHEKSCADKSHP